MNWIIDKANVRLTCQSYLRSTIAGHFIYQWLILRAAFSAPQSMHWWLGSWHAYVHSLAARHSSHFNDLVRFFLIVRRTIVCTSSSLCWRFLCEIVNPLQIHAFKNLNEDTILHVPFQWAHGELFVLCLCVTMSLTVHKRIWDVRLILASEPVRFKSSVCAFVANSVSSLQSFMSASYGKSLVLDKRWIRYVPRSLLTRKTEQWHSILKKSYMTRCRRLWDRNRGFGQTKKNSTTELSNSGGVVAVAHIANGFQWKKFPQKRGKWGEAKKNSCDFIACDFWPLSLSFERTNHHRLHPFQSLE